MESIQNELQCISNLQEINSKDRKKVIQIFLLAIFILIFVSYFPLEWVYKIEKDPPSQKISSNLIDLYACDTVVDTPTKSSFKKFEDISETKKPVITVHREKVIEKLIQEIEVEEIDNTQSIFLYSDDPLTAPKGTTNGPSGKETWYNLDMSGVVSKMRNLGFDEAKYPYWVRDDGVKMLGSYAMVAADLNIRPRGTILETSLGLGIVCDTGEFAKTNNMQLDIAVNW